MIGVQGHYGDIRKVYRDSEGHMGILRGSSNIVGILACMYGLWMQSL